MDWNQSERRIFLSRIFALKQKRQFDEMEEEVQTALERFPSDAEFQVLLADALMHTGRASEAQKVLDDMGDSGQGLASYHAMQASLQFQHHRYKEALESFRCAHSIRPSEFYLKRQADCLLAMGRREQALALLVQLPGRDTDPYILGAMARAHEGLGNLEEARKCYEDVLRVSPGDSYAESRVLQLKASGKDEGTAEREVDRLLRMPSRKDDPALLEVKIQQLKKKGDYQGVAEIYSRLAQAGPENQRDFYRRSLAFAYYRAGMIVEAFALLRDLIEERPQDAYIRSTLVASARKLGRQKELAGFFFGLARKSPAHHHFFGVARKLNRQSKTSPKDRDED